MLNCIIKSFLKVVDLPSASSINTHLFIIIAFTSSDAVSSSRKEIILYDGLSLHTLSFTIGNTYLQSLMIPTNGCPLSLDGDAHRLGRVDNAIHAIGTFLGGHSGSYSILSVRSLSTERQLRKVQQKQDTVISTPCWFRTT